MPAPTSSRRTFLSQTAAASATLLARPSFGANTASASVHVLNGVPSAAVDEAVLFPFDDRSIVFGRGLRLDLVPAKKHGEHPPIVLRHGQPGDPDAVAARYYGTVIQVGDEFRMWYQGVAADDSATGFRQRRLCYAVSKDGVNWEKPKLGLVEYNGSKANNLVKILEGNNGLAANPIIYDPDDPDPKRRFKMVFESVKYSNAFSVAFSADGLTWLESPKNPVGPMLEQSGLIKFNGYYYVNGQGPGHYGGGRRMQTYASYDFENWTQASAVSFRRGPRYESPTDRWNAIEEIHLGAGLWNRGNVILGIYGMWHGHETGDREYITMDLGFVVSNDAVHFHEPIADFRLVPSWEESETPAGTGPALMQGQGMANVGDKTLFWYESWRAGGVRLARWDRDRLGYLSTFGKPDNPHVISCPLQFDRLGAIFVNADGLNENTRLTVELLDPRFLPLSNYSAEDSAPLHTSGLRQRVTWKNRPSVERFSHPVSVKVSFGGLRPEDAKLYAIYGTAA